MFDISGWEFLTLGIIAVIIFGPDRLPAAAADAGKLIRHLRRYVQGAKDDLSKELGPDFADVKVSDLTPRGVLRKALGPDDPFEELRDLGKEVDVRKDIDGVRSELDGLRRSPFEMQRAAKPLSPGEVPPFDPDAT